MITSQTNGHKIWFNQNESQWLYCDNNECVDKVVRPCVKCGKMPTKQGHDYCIRNLPNVKNACCGHGVEQGYIQNENGIVYKLK